MTLTTTPTRGGGWSRAAAAMAACLLISGISAGLDEGAVATTEPSTASTPTAPVTIPALRAWQPASGVFTLGDQSRIVIVGPVSPNAAQVADTLATDLALLTSRRPLVVRAGASAVRPGDVALGLGAIPVDTTPTSTIRSQSYRLRVDDVVRVTAPSAHGLFLGTRSVLQLLRSGPTLPRGTADDGPVVAERAVMVDVARKFYDVAWLRDLVRQMSYLKYTTLHLHLTDDQGFRIASRSHPEVVSDQHYGRGQMRRFLDFAGRHHIDVVPEINMPGHFGAVLAQHPELRLVAADGTPNPSALDLTDPAAYDLARDLIVEYTRFFPGRDFHLGADEWLSERRIGDYPQLAAYARETLGPDARARDVEYAFVNWANELVRERGKRMRIWNDQLVSGYTVDVDPSVVIDNWYDGAEFGVTPQSLADAGHSLVNSNWDLLYYIVGITRTDPAAVYETFSTTGFAGGRTITDPRALLGTQFSIWGDLDPEAESAEQVAYGISKPLRAVAQRAWGSPRPTTTYDDFVALVDRVGNAPGYDQAEVPWDDVPLASSSMDPSPVSSLANLVDRRPGTTFETATAPRRDDWVQLDLRSPTRVGAVNVRMPAPVTCLAFEGSTDATSWTSLGAVAEGSEAQVLAVGAGPLRFVRLRFTCDQPAPVAIGELGVAVEESRADGLSSSLPTYAEFALSRAGDGDPSSYFWGGRGARVDDYLLRDLGVATPLTGISLLMASPPDRTGDYLRQIVIETSLDGASWTTVGAFSDQPEVDVDVTGTTARYVRVRSTANQGPWSIVRELTIR